MKTYTVYGEVRITQGETNSDRIATVQAASQKEAKELVIAHAKRTMPYSYFSRYFRFYAIVGGNPQKAINI